jgi:hypothetical protein
MASSKSSIIFLLNKYNKYSNIGGVNGNNSYSIKINLEEEKRNENN